MKLYRTFALVAFALVAPLAAHSQGPCGPGQVLEPVVINGTTYYECVTPAAAAPEVSVSSSIGGLAVLMGGILMLRGRKRMVRTSVVAA